MDAWETLIDGSTISSGDAWEHLDAQRGGGDPGDIKLMLVNGMRASVSDIPVTGAVIDESMAGSIVSESITASITTDALAGAINSATLSGNITADNLAGAI